MEYLLEILKKEPLLPFAILLVVILAVPPIFERLRLPGLVGLLVAGVCLGKNGLGVLQHGSETMKLLSNIGLVYLMFVAGLEIELAQFRKTKNRSIGFGSSTFLVPMIFGTVVGRIFNFDWNASILIGSLFASHTLLAYPIVSRLGVVNNEAVTVTIGATIFTDIGALLVLAICVGINRGDFNIYSLLYLFGSLFAYSAIVLFGFDWAGKQYFRRNGDNEGNQFLFVLMAVFLAALGAQLIGVEKIVGAFLAGLAVNDAVGEGAVKEKVIFVGSVLFIPIFFVDMGLLIDLPAFIESISSFWLTIAIVVGLISSKFFAALFAALAYRYKRREMLAMWSLSLPQVAATLAATLVGVQEKILTPAVLNSVIVLMIVTSILGPLITSRVAPGLEVPERNLIPESPTSEPETAPRREFTVIVPVYNPRTEKHLIEMAALLARHEAGRIVPLSVVKAQAHMDAAEIDEAFARSDRLLEIATKVSQKLAVAAEPLVRIDDDFAQAISYASREQKASLIVMGWGNRTGLRARLFGNVIDSVLWTSHCPVAVTRLLESPLKIQRILVPLENLSSEQVSPVRFAKILAETNQAQVTLMQVCDRRTSAAQIEAASSQLSTLAANWMPAGNFNVQIIPHDDVVRAIAQAAPNFDLAIWRFRRQRTAAGLAVGDITNQLVQQLTCSVVLLGEPQRIEGK